MQDMSAVAAMHSAKQAQRSGSLIEQTVLTTVRESELFCTSECCELQHIRIQLDDAPWCIPFPLHLSTRALQVCST